MPKGTPIGLKCPRCRRGKWGYERTVKGVQLADEYEGRVHRTRSSSAGGCGGPTKVGHRRKVECLDCGHVWFTTLYMKKKESSQ